MDTDAEVVLDSFVPGDGESGVFSLLLWLCLAIGVGVLCTKCTGNIAQNVCLDGSSKDM